MIYRWESTEELRVSADIWDHLWQRTATAQPGARAALVANWVDHFAPGAKFRAVGVGRGGQLLAVLPLVSRTLKRWVNVGSLPTGEWAFAGDLLLDPQCDVASVLDEIVAQLLRQGWPMLWLENTPYEEPRWQQFLDACRRAGLPISIRPQYRVGQVEISHDWATYEASLSGDHRRNRKKQLRQLEAEGPVELAIHRPTERAEIDRLVRIGFEVEDRSWKGTAGTSVLRTPGMLEYFQREARQLADWDQLELAFLLHNGQPIAFFYGAHAKGVRFTSKVGYDEQFKKFGPGHLLMWKQLQRLHADPEAHLVDFNGPLVPWFESWATRSYALARVVVGGATSFDRGLFLAYEHLFPRLKQWQGRLHNFRRPQPVATA